MLIRTFILHTTFVLKKKGVESVEHVIFSAEKYSIGFPIFNYVRRDNMRSFNCIIISKQAFSSSREGLKNIGYG
ncbi:hypothetical protein ACJX0J_028439, partial [Zea mays]